MLLTWSQWFSTFMVLYLFQRIFFLVCKQTSRDLGRRTVHVFDVRYSEIKNWISYLPFLITEQITPYICYIFNTHTILNTGSNNCPLHFSSWIWTPVEVIIFRKVILPFAIRFRSRLFIRRRDLLDRRQTWRQLLDPGVCGRHVAADRLYKQQL